MKLLFSETIYSSLSDDGIYAHILDEPLPIANGDKLKVVFNGFDVLATAVETVFSDGENTARILHIGDFPELGLGSELMPCCYIHIKESDESDEAVILIRVEGTFTIEVYKEYDWFADLFINEAKKALESRANNTGSGPNTPGGNAMVLSRIGNGEPLTMDIPTDVFHDTYGFYRLWDETPSIDEMLGGQILFVPTNYGIFPLIEETLIDGNALAGLPLYAFCYDPAAVNSGKGLHYIKAVVVVITGEHEELPWPPGIYVQEDFVSSGMDKETILIYGHDFHFDDITYCDACGNSLDECTCGPAPIEPCPNCGIDNGSWDGSRCTDCGYTLACPECGAYAEDGWHGVEGYCTNCGHGSDDVEICESCQNPIDQCICGEVCDTCGNSLVECTCGQPPIEPCPSCGIDDGSWDGQNCSECGYEAVWCQEHEMYAHECGCEVCPECGKVIYFCECNSFDDGTRCPQCGAMDEWHNNKCDACDYSVCPSCGIENLWDGLHCSECGYMICPNCGIGDGSWDDFQCSNCGYFPCPNCGEVDGFDGHDCSNCGYIVTICPSDEMPSYLCGCTTCPECGENTSVDESGACTECGYHFPWL